MRDRPPKTLLIIGPTLFDCWRAVRHFGLDPARLCHHRNITKAEALRGITPGSPFIAVDRETWAHTQGGQTLHLMLDCLESTMRVRGLRDDETSLYQEKVPA